MLCILCERAMYPQKTGEPWLGTYDKPICYSCYVDLIQEIYKMAGMGDGGIIHLIFQECLRSGHNRKRKPTVRNYRKVFKQICQKYNFQCVHCGSNDELTIDHITPVKKGGTDDPENLQVLCKSCNSKKGTK